MIIYNKQEIKTMYWRTKEGQQFSIDGTDEGYPKMTDSHLINAIKLINKRCDKLVSELIERSYQPYSEKYNHYLSLLTRESYSELILEYLEDKSPNFKFLLTELEKRNLEIEIKFPYLEETRDSALMATDYGLEGEEHPFYTFHYEAWELAYMGGD